MRRAFSTSRSTLNRNSAARDISFARDELLGQAVLQRRHRKIIRLTDVCPNVARFLLRGTGGRMHFIAQPGIVGLPGNQGAAACAVEAQTVPGALDVARDHATGREPRAAVRASVGDDAGLAFPVAPRNQFSSQCLEAHRSVVRQIFGGEHRIPVIRDAKLQPPRYVVCQEIHAFVQPARAHRHSPQARGVSSEKPATRL